MSDTIFGKIIRKEIPAEVVYENPRVIAFRDVRPQAPTHILVLPKSALKDPHSATTADQALLGELIVAAGDIAKAEGLTESGYRLVINAGKFQEVPHLHVHLLGGRPMAWPPG